MYFGALVSKHIDARSTTVLVPGGKARTVFLRPPNNCEWMAERSKEMAPIVGSFYYMIFEGIVDIIYCLVTENHHPRCV